jgi:ribokinase
MENEQMDFLAIGDIVTDAFIRIKDAEVKKCVNHARQELCLSFGDKVAYESMQEVRGVGNSANAAVAAARLGMKSGLIAHVGNDQNGKNCIDELTQNKVDTHFIHQHDGIPTNYHYVLWYDVERTILVKHAAFPTLIPNIPIAPKMLYLSSLGDHTEKYHQEIAAYVAAHPDMLLVFQPGTFQIKLGAETLKDIYAHTYAFFCNLEEAQRILNTQEKELPMLIKALHKLGPKIVFITDGINGAYASNGSEAWFMPVYPHDPYERTGAGDAFASTVSVALLMGKSISEALAWGPINSMSVVQYVGAQEGLLSQEKIQEYVTKAPPSYAPQPLF